MADAVMIMAAGFGTRMGALTRNRPKPLIEVAGRTLLDRTLDLTDGIARKVVNTHYLGEQIAAHLADRSDILLSHEAPEILETGGGLRRALPLLAADPVFTLNSDAVWTGPKPLDTLRHAWDADSMDALLLLVPVDRAIGHSGTGDFALQPDGRILRGSGTVYTGAQIVSTGGLGDIPEPAFSMNLLWDRMAVKRRLYGVMHPGGWCDVGRPEGIAEAEAMLSADADV